MIQHVFHDLAHSWHHLAPRQGSPRTIEATLRGLSDSPSTRNVASKREGLERNTNGTNSCRNTVAIETQNCHRITNGNSIVF